jgi:ribosomal protein S25
MAVFSHQQEIGTPITPGELAARMDIPPALAESILDHLKDSGTPPPVTEANGAALSGSRP